MRGEVGGLGRGREGEGVGWDGGGHFEFFLEAAGGEGGEGCGGEGSLRVAG